MGAGAKIVQLNPDLSAQLQSGSGTPTGPASGDLSGAFPAPTVIGIGGVPVDPPDGSSADFLNGLGHWTVPPGSTVSLPWFDMVTDGGLDPTGAADNTALFNTALGTATSSGTVSRTLYFPPGTYKIAGQIAMPAVSTSASQITIRLLGAARPPFAVHGPLATPGGYSILKSTLASGTGSIISGSAGGANNISVVLENLIAIAPDDPPLPFFDLSNTQGGAVRDVQISVEAYTGSVTPPTHTGAYGIALPGNNQSNYTYVDGLQVGGFYIGVYMGELAIVRGLIVGLCIHGVVVPFAYHAGLIVDMQQTYCTYGISADGTGAARYIDILQYDAEHHGYGGTWPNTAYDLNDPTNLLIGHTRWLGVLSGSGNDHSFTVNGGANMLREEIGQPPAGTLTDPTSSEGDMIYRTSGALARLGVGAAGTVLTGGTDPLWGSGPLSTKGDLFGYSTTGVRVGVGTNGQVLKADSTAAAGVSWGDLPATASGGTDHEHVMDCLFDGDGSTVAFELPVAPFDQWSVAAYVAGTLTEVTLSGTMLTTATFGSAPGSGTSNVRFDIVAATF